MYLFFLKADSDKFYSQSTDNFYSPSYTHVKKGLFATQCGNPVNSINTSERKLSQRRLKWDTSSQSVLDSSPRACKAFHLF